MRPVARGRRKAGRITSAKQMRHEQPGVTASRHHAAAESFVYANGSRSEAAQLLPVCAVLGQNETEQTNIPMRSCEHRVVGTALGGAPCGATTLVRDVPKWAGPRMRTLPLGPSVELPSGPRSS
eukprot:4265039-Pyramimonas_sp.AAC.1